MENERDQQDVLMALQGMGRMSLMMDPVFKLTATDCKCAGGKLERTGKKWISLTDGRTECPLHSDAGSE